MNRIAVLLRDELTDLDRQLTAAEAGMTTLDETAVMSRLMLIQSLLPPNKDRLSAIPDVVAQFTFKSVDAEHATAVLRMAWASAIRTFTAYYGFGVLNGSKAVTPSMPSRHVAS